MGACHCGSREAPVSSENVTAGASAEQILPLKLMVLIIGARGVRKGDWFPGRDKSECYCTVRIAGTDEILHKTGDQQEGVEPLWNEEIEVDYYLNDSLEFSVWGSVPADTKMPEGSSNRLIGRFIMASSMFEYGGFNGEVQLENLGKDIMAAYLTVKIKIQDQEYPDGPDPEFNISLTKDPKAAIGLDFDTQDENMVYVADIKPGPVQFYNLNVKPSEQLKPGYFIVEANGFSGQAAQLIEVMKKETMLHLLIRRSTEMTVSIIKKDKKTPLGMEFHSKMTGNHMMILDITDGPVYQWNVTHPQLEIKCGDRIVAVNGQKGKANDLLKKMKGLAQFQMTIVRPVSSE